MTKEKTMQDGTIYISEHKWSNGQTIYTVNIKGYPFYNYSTFDKEEAIIVGVNDAADYIIEMEN